MKYIRLLPSFHDIQMARKVCTSRQAGIRIAYIFENIAANGLAMQTPRASLIMVFTLFSWNIGILQRLHQQE